MDLTLLQWLIPVVGVIAIVYAAFLARDVLARDTGTPEMQRVADAIFRGAVAFLRRQYTTIGILAVVTSVLIGILIAVLPGSTNGLSKNISPALLGVMTSVAFLLGALCSAISGYVGMFVAVRSNLRTAAAARKSLNDALQTALRGGAVSGFLVVALSLLGVFFIYTVYGALAGGTPSEAVAQAPFLIVGFAFGASFVALFAQLGGGIYTKAADVGADLVGKVEAGIPEDDPRNPAVIADLVGDNVGDCAGRGADLFESTAAENIGAMILGVVLFRVTGSTNIAWIIFPLIVQTFGILASMVGLQFTRIPAGSPVNDSVALAALNRGYYVVAGLSAVIMFALAYFLFPGGGLWFGLAGLVGIVTSIAFVYITQYYTTGSARPVRELAEASRPGAATTIISGIAIGFETTALPTITIAIALLSSYWLGQQGVPTAVAGTGVILVPGSTDLVQLGESGLQISLKVASGVFGTAVATMGMLMSAAYILAMDTFGPITDNAGGIVEMSGQPESIRNVTDALDSVGNTTKALTKGYAVGSAALAAFLLFTAYLDKVREIKPSLPTIDGVLPINLSSLPVFIGGFFGAMLVFLFSSLAIRAVGNAAQGMIAEVRRQFRADPGIMAGTSTPDYAACVDVSARAALREMVLPGILAVGTPVVIGLLLRWEAAGGLLMVGTMTGVLMANVLNNGGGAWDNAKMFIEAGGLKGPNGEVRGKGSDEHKAAVVGDTVGDPWKDTAGPSLHVLIKLLATITLVLAPLFV
jgi:K(+)-stimulated pyrophosphate-energized sodium pump